jgi:hypothetical protein
MHLTNSVPQNKHKILELILFMTPSNPQFYTVKKFQRSKKSRFTRKVTRICLIFIKSVGKDFLKLPEGDADSERILGSGSVKKLIEITNRKYFWIRMRSGSKNWTECNANANGLRFLNPDSRFFYANSPRYFPVGQAQKHHYHFYGFSWTCTDWMVAPFQAIPCVWGRHRNALDAWLLNECRQFKI